jgi:hypothetical protein
MFQSKICRRWKMIKIGLLEAVEHVEEREIDRGSSRVESASVTI